MSTRPQNDLTPTGCFRLGLWTTRKDFKPQLNEKKCIYRPKIHVPLTSVQCSTSSHQGCAPPSSLDSEFLLHLIPVGYRSHDLSDLQIFARFPENINVFRFFPPNSPLSPSRSSARSVTSARVRCARDLSTELCPLWEVLLISTTHFTFLTCTIPLDSNTSCLARIFPINKGVSRRLKNSSQLRHTIATTPLQPTQLYQIYPY